MADQKKFAVFDIDGTLIRWQLYHVVVDRLAKHGSLGTEAHAKIREARMKWKNRENNDGFYEYEKMLVSIFEESITNLKSVEIDLLIEDIIDEYKDQVYTYTRDLIKSLKEKGYFLLAISGSHHELVSKLSEYYGFDDFIGSQYERSGDGFSGNSSVPSFDKASSLKQLVSENGLSFSGSYAIGDSLSDAAMLELVENPIAFNPDKKLFKQAQSNQWKIVEERKNMIYQLMPTGGVYELII